MKDLSEPEMLSIDKEGHENSAVVEIFETDPVDLHYTRPKNGKDHWTMKDENSNTMGRVYPDDDLRVDPPQYD